MLSGLVGDVFASGTVITNNAIISGQVDDLDAANNSGTANFTIFDFVSSSDLILTKSVNTAYASSGDIVIYTLTYTNS
ncbi:hypothetical protein KBC03_05120 [Patescibacteria group bacterium]|nr:hypothetical protein [Patescibacteria group bacterium]